MTLGTLSVIPTARPEKEQRRRGRGRRRRRKIHCGTRNHRLNTDRMKERSGKGREKGERGCEEGEEEQREE